MSRIDSADGIFFTAWIRDLSERRQAEEALRHSEAQLRQAQKMEAVGRLAGGVAHDFNNLLTVILGYADLVLDGLDPRRSAAATTSRRSSAPRNRAAGLTRQLLAFSRKQVLQPRRRRPQRGRRRTWRRCCAGSIGEDDRPAHRAWRPRLWAVQADPGQIEQVLMNLAVNARDAMPDGGTLTIATAERGPRRRTMRRRWSGSSRAASCA